MDFTEKNFLGLEELVRASIHYYRHKLFPKYYASSDYPKSLKNALELLYPASEAENIFCAFEKKLPEIEEILETDVQAAYEGDPAALNYDEVILAYPGVKAITIFRLAHVLYELRVPIIPRLMTEYAHHTTGIDIHPGATIGRYFFIDHGTGVVIGETTIIGEHVKLYQHVTLGAKSFPKNADGSLVKGIKRHPNIGNNVVIYAGATILGGDTYIGDNCVIGGNVWLTESLPAGETIHIHCYEEDCRSDL